MKYLFLLSFLVSGSLSLAQQAQGYDISKCNFAVSQEQNVVISTKTFDDTTSSARVACRKATGDESACTLLDTYYSGVNTYAVYKATFYKTVQLKPQQMAQLRCEKLEKCSNDALKARDEQAGEIIEGYQRRYKCL